MLVVDVTSLVACVEVLIEVKVGSGAVTLLAESTVIVGSMECSVSELK